MKVIVPPREGRAMKVLRGQTIRITTPKGAQAADFFAYNAENVGEWLSANHTWVTTFCVRPRPGDEFLSRFRRPMLRFAEDGAEGAATYAKNYQQIDLLLTDISLPGLRGPDLARYARQLQPSVEVLFMSGSIQFEEKSVADEIYRSGCLEKPFTAEQLRDRVAARLGVKAMCAS